jgi:ZIP family zinc transporter
MIPEWLNAGLWGLLAGSALLIGASLGYFTKISQKWIASVMAFGSGVLISAISFELMDEAYKSGGFDSTSIGFIAGGTVYTLINFYLSNKGAKHRKRSQKKQPSENEHEGSGLMIAIGSLIDGIPESIVIGLTLLKGGAVSTTAVVAIFISNIPEGLSSSAGMKTAGRSAIYIFTLWAIIALASGAASAIGYSAFQNFSADVVAATTAIAAGAMIVMIVSTMIPEAFEEVHSLIGLITLLGFLISFILSKLE